MQVCLLLWPGITLSSSTNESFFYVLRHSTRNQLQKDNVSSQNQHLISLSYNLILPSLAQDWKQEFLKAYNEARYEVGLGSLVWGDEVAAYASSYENLRISDCAMVHSNGPFGENIAWSNGDVSAGDASEMWIDEKKYYNYIATPVTIQTMARVSITHKWFGKILFEWNGCAKVVCNIDGTFITCNYDPPGNYNGEKPY